jgi:branched-chain amino acid aminotransferase
MELNQLFAVTEAGAQALVLPPGTNSLTAVYAGLALGVYSALRTFEHNKFLDLDGHLERAERSMRLLGWDYHLDRARLKRALHSAASAYPAPEARVRFDILGRPAHSLGCDSRELIALTPFEPDPKRYYAQGVGVDFVPDLVRFEPLAKTAEFAQRRNRLLPARSRAHYEYLLLDESDQILEGTLTNFWAVRDGQVWTAGMEVLEGITRKILLDLLPGMGIAVHLQALNKSEVHTFDEAFLSGSSRAVVPVVRIAGHEIGNGRPGPITRQILRAYQAYVTQNVRTAV